MKKRTTAIFKSLILIGTFPIVITSCKKEADEPQPAAAATLEVKTYSNLFANDPDGHYTFYSLRTNSIVTLSDSASANWDLAFRATGILVNNGTSGPGQGGAVVLSQSFDDVHTAPGDNTFSVDNGAASAIPGGSGNGWYYYDGANNVILPIAGRTLVIRTADGKYGKVEILSYYKDAPANPTSSDISRYYKFRFAFQNDGSDVLK